MLIAISKAIIEESAKCTGFSDLKKEQQEAMEHFVNFVSLPTGYVITMLLSLEPESLYECIQSCMIFVIFLFQVQQAALLFASACSLPCSLSFILLMDQVSNF